MITVQPIKNEWLKTGGKWYWFQTNSTMAVNTNFYIQDNLYFVDGNGVMLSGCWKKKTEQNTISKMGPSL